MGFFGNMLESSVVKKFSTKTVDDFCALSCEARAYALLSAADLATSELGDADSYESMLAYRVILAPYVASSNDCMAIFDVFLDDHTKIERLAKKQLVEYERRVSREGQLNFIRAGMNNRLMAMRIILFLLADGAGKVQSDICKRFYISLHESDDDMIMMDAATIFTDRRKIENDTNADIPIIGESDITRYKGIVRLWDAAGVARHVR